MMATTSVPVDTLCRSIVSPPLVPKYPSGPIEFICPLNLEALQNVKPITMLQDLIIFCLPEVIELPGFCWDWFNPLTCRLLDRLYIPGRRGGANWLSSTTYEIFNEVVWHAMVNWRTFRKRELPCKKNKNNLGRRSSGNMIRSKIVNFDRTEAGITLKWGRISPAVQCCSQNQSNCTVRRWTSPHDVA